MADDDNDACPCIPPEIYAEWETMTPTQRMPYVTRHMNHVWSDLFEPSPSAERLTKQGD